MVQKLLLIISVFFITLLIGCSSYDKTSKSIDTNIKTKKSQRKIFVSTSLGVHDNQSYDSTNNWFKLETKDVFSPNISLGNDYPVSNKYRLFFFLDYEQVSVEYNGEDKRYIDIKLEPNSKEDLKVKIKNIADGQHDFMVLTIREPREYVDQSRFIPGNEIYHYRRTRLVVGENIGKDITYSKVSTEAGNFQGTLVMTRNKQDSLENALTIIKPNQLETSWIKVPVNENSKLALIGIADTEQISLKQPYMQVEGQGILNIPLRELNDINPLINSKNLTYIAIASPYSEVEASVTFTNRLIIDQE